MPSPTRSASPRASATQATSLCSSGAEPGPPSLAIEGLEWWLDLQSPRQALDQREGGGGGQGRAVGVIERVGSRSTIGSTTASIALSRSASSFTPAALTL